MPPAIQRMLKAMLGIDRRVLRAAWTVFLFALALLVIYAIRKTLVLFALALFLAHLLGPIVERVHWMLPPSRSRGPAIAVVYLAAIGIVVGLAIPMGSKIGNEAVVLASKLPAAIQSAQVVHVRVPAWLEDQQAQIDMFLQQRLSQLSQNLGPMLSAAGEQILLGLGNLFDLILVPILAFFVLKDGTAIRRALVGNARPGSRHLIDEILLDLHNLLARYIRALILLAAATFVSFSSVFTLMGVPYGLLLAGVAALLEVIPVLGPLTAACIIVLVALLSGFHHVVLLILFLGAYRLFQDYVLSPFLMSEGVELHPLLVLFGVLAGEQIAGVGGMFFSVPVLAALRAVLHRLRLYRERIPVVD